MARDGSGGHSLPYGTYTPGTLADADKVTADFADLSAAIAQSISKDGQTTPTGNLPMGSNKLTGLGAGSAATDSASLGQVQAQAWKWCGTAGGTADALTLTPAPAVTAYAAGQAFRFIAGGSNNTDAATIAVSGLTTKAVQNDGSALIADDIVAGKLYEALYDGTAFQLRRVALGIPSSAIGSTVQAYDADTSKLDVAETRSASLNFADQEAIRPKLKDYGETVNAIGSIGGGTQDIDIELGNVVTGTVDTSTTTFTFSNPSASGTACSFTLILTNGGSQTVNWPASVDWPGGAAPSLTASGVDVISFYTTDGGTTWYGVSALNFS